MRITQIMVSEGGGGVERIAPDMCLSLAEAGHQIQLILHAKFDLPSIYQHHNIAVFRANIRNRRDLVSRWRIARAVKAFKPDVAHLHLRQGVTLANKLCQRQNIPTITSMHNYGNPKAYNKVDKITVPTHSLHQFLNENGVADNKIHYVANFSRMPTIPVATTQPSPVQFCAFGRFVEKKGFSTLLSAVSLLRDKGEDIHLTLAGQGPTEESLRSQILENQLEKHITLLPWQKDATTFIDAHDVFVLPSLDEPFGLVVLEAAARGKPIITSKTAGPVEIVDDASAYLFDIGNAEQLAQKMQDVIANPAESLKKAQRAQGIYTNQYSHHTFVTEIEKVYASMQNSRQT